MATYVMVSDSNNTKYGTAVASAVVAVGGAGYTVNDVLTISTGDANATVTVTTVVAGVVTAVSRTVVGSGYSAGTKATTGGTGAGCTITITIDSLLTTVNGFYKASGYNLGAFSTTSLAISTPRTIAWTPSQAGTLQGIVLCISGGGVAYSATSSYSVTVQLQQNTGSWVNVGTAVTLTAAQISSMTATYNNMGGGYIVPFKGINHAVTTDASTWRVYISQAGSGAGWHLITSDATNPFFVAWDSGTTTWVDNTGADTYVPVMVDLITADDDFTTRGLLGTTETNRATGMVICRGSDASVANVAMFKLKVDPDSASTWTQDGVVLMGSHSAVRCGTDASRNTIAKKWTISIKYTPTSGTATNSGFREPRSSSGGGCGANTKMAGFFFYGEVPTYTKSLMSYDVAIGGTFTAAVTNVITKTGHLFRSGIPTPFQCSSSTALPAGLSAATTYWAMSIAGNTFYAYPTYADAIATTNQIDITDTGTGTHTLNSVVITDDSTGWLSGDIISVAMRNTKGGTAVDYTSYALDGDASGTTFLITPNLASYSGHAGGHVMNLSRRGIAIKSDNAAQYARNSFSQMSNFTLDGVYLYNTYWMGGYTGSASPTYDDAANRSQFLIKNCGIWNAGATVFFSTTPNINEDGLLCDGTMLHLSSVSTWTGGFSEYYTYKASGAYTIQNCVSYFVSGSWTGGTNFYDNYFHHGYSCFAGFSNTAGAINGNHFWGFGGGSSTISAGAIDLYTNVNASYAGNYYDNCDYPLLLTPYSVVGTVFDGEVFNSKGYTANTADIITTWASGGYAQAEFRNCSGINVLTRTNLHLMQDGSLIKLVDCTGTAIVSNYDSYLAYGVITSNNSNKIYQQNVHADYTLVNSYNFGSQTVTGYPVYISVNVDIGFAAYYAGTHTNPNMTIDYDNGTTSAAVLTTDTTDQQNISDIITPTTNNNTITVNLNQKTDASFADSKVTYDTLVMNLRKYGYTFQDTTTTIYQTDSAIQQVMATPTLNGYITEYTEATVGAYTDFTINHTTQTCTITADTTMAKLYDYSQWDLANDGGANGGTAQWFTTLDGVNFTSTYDIILNTGVDLTGGGTIDVGAGTFTKTGTATYDGIIIYTASREVHLTLAGLVAGSTVQVYDNTAAAELYNDVVVGTSLDYVYTYTVDSELRIRVRQAGYIPYEYTGNIVNTGLSLNVAQDVDDVYVANSIDGSTVTEFSLSGATVKIYVDDPTNATTGQRMYNWYMYAIATTTYIGIQPNDITAQTAWSYQLADAILLYNQDAVNPVFLEGANINNVSANGQVIDTAGGMININGYFPFNSAADVGTAVAENADFSLSNLLIKDKLS